MGKHIFRERACITCSKSYTPTGPRNRWCSLLCRIIDQVDRSGGVDACWPWKASTDKNGYGEITIKDGTHPSGTYFAHRIALEVLGCVTVADSDVVRHSCDNPICCRPAHLFTGTQADNVRDMIERKRQQDYTRAAKGEDHPMAKVTAQTAMDIFTADGSSHHMIAARFGVSVDLVQHIKSGRTWTDSTGAQRTTARVGEQHHSAKLTADAVRTIRAFSGPARVIASQFGVSEVLIGKIRKRQLWSHVE